MEANIEDDAGKVVDVLHADAAARLTIRGMFLGAESRRNEPPMESSSMWCHNRAADG